MFVDITGTRSTGRSEKIVTTYAANASHKIVPHTIEYGYMLMYVFDNMWFMFIYYLDIFTKLIYNFFKPYFIYVLSKNNQD